MMGWLFGNSEPRNSNFQGFCAYTCSYKFINIVYEKLPTQVICPYCSLEFILSEDLETRTPIEYELYIHKINYISTLELIQNNLEISTKVRTLIGELKRLELNSSDNKSLASYAFYSGKRKTKVISDLADIGHKSTIPALVFILKDRSNFQEALEAIGQIGGERAVKIIQKMINLGPREHFENGLYNSSEHLRRVSFNVPIDGEYDAGPEEATDPVLLNMTGHYPSRIKDEAIKILATMKDPSAVEPLVKNVILGFKSYLKDFDNLKNFENEANKKLSEYLLDRQKTENEVFQKTLTDEDFFLVEEHILKAIGATGGSKNPAIRKLSIRGIISSFIINREDIKIIEEFKTQEELVKALDQNEYVLQYYKKKVKDSYDSFSHIYNAYPRNKHSSKEIDTVSRASIVKALGMLWYSKASNSIIKIMKNIQLEEVEREYKHLLIRECAKSLGIFNLKKSLKPLKDAKVFCKKNYAYDALKEIHTALALLGEKDSVLHIVREFKRDEEDSKIKGIIESIDTEVLGEVFEELELYDDAENLYTKNGMLKQAAKMRRNKAAQGAAKIDQTVVHGDYVDDRDTIVKDSVINRSNIGSNSKAEDLREAKSLFEEGLIDQSEYKQMKKEILGK